MSIQCTSTRTTNAEQIVAFLRNQQAWWCRSCISSFTHVAHPVVCDVIRRVRTAVRYYDWQDWAECEGCGEMKPSIRFSDN